MKNIIFLLAGIIAMMLVGCGEGASTESAVGAVSAPAQTSSVPEPVGVDSLPNIPSIPIAG